MFNVSLELHESSFVFQCRRMFDVYASLCAILTAVAQCFNVFITFFMTLNIVELFSFTLRMS